VAQVAWTSASGLGKNLDASSAFSDTLGAFSYEMRLTLTPSASAINAPGFLFAELDYQMPTYDVGR
jgi:hypothetical protein